jgi:transposase
MTLLRETKQRIVDLATHTSKSYREIGLEVGVHHKTVQRIMKIWEETGSLEDHREDHRGGRNKLDERTQRIIARESRKNPKRTAKEIQAAAGPVAKDVSLRTVQRCLVKRGRKAYRPVRTPCLSKRHRQARFKWANEVKYMSTEDWKEVFIFLTLLTYIYILFYTL